MITCSEGKAAKRRDKRRMRRGWQGSSSRRGYFRRFYGSWRIRDRLNQAELSPGYYAWLETWFLEPMDEITWRRRFYWK